MIEKELYILGLNYINHDASAFLLKITRLLRQLWKRDSLGSKRS